MTVTDAEDLARAGNGEDGRARPVQSSASWAAGAAAGAVERAQRLARGLGWWGVGLGLAQLLAPGAFARALVGGDRRRGRAALVAVGLRGLVSGAGLLTSERPAGWLWTRLAGDAMDLALLGGALVGRDARPQRIATAMGAVLGMAALDAYASRALGRTDARDVQPAHAVKAVTINRPPDEVYRFWRNLGNLPAFMNFLESVEVLDDRRSHWVARLPLGGVIEWQAEIVADRPGELIAWRTLPGARVAHTGEVRFVRAPAGRGTEVRVFMLFQPPGGPLGVTVARLFGRAPAVQIAQDLRRFKQVMETGEVVHSDASIHRTPHPARPSADGDGDGGDGA
jgi:uncharacterized membrane protein